MSDGTREIRCKGLGVSEGIVIGQVLRMHDGTQHVYHWRMDESAVEAERQRFRTAVELARQQVRSIKEAGRTTLRQRSRLHFRCPSACCSRMRN